MQKILESRFFIPVLLVLYASLAGLLFYITGTRTKGQIELLLTQWIPKVLWRSEERRVG